MRNENSDNDSQDHHSVQNVDHIVMDGENPLDMVSDKGSGAGDDNKFNALGSIRDDGQSDRLFDIQSLQGTAS